MGWTSAGTIVYTLVLIALLLGSCTFALPVLVAFLLPDILIAEISNMANLVFSKAKQKKSSPNLQSGPVSSSIYSITHKTHSHVDPPGRTIPLFLDTLQAQTYILPKKANIQPRISFQPTKTPQ